MGNRNFKNITMHYLTLRWFTLNNFKHIRLKQFHSLEKALKNTHNLCWYDQTENYLKKEFKKIKMNNIYLTKIKNFDNKLNRFLTNNKIESKMFLSDIDFIHKCDEIICRKLHINTSTSDIFTSLP